MSENLFDFVDDLADDDGAAGFRLDRIELYNWGTFDGRITTLRLDGRNTLLTGENGSGKSTFVDALTTLLVPSQRIAYNRAAGAEVRERDLRSYVLGYYRSEYNEQTGASRPVALRTTNSYSVVLGVFRNKAFGQTVSLAQVFWPADSGQPNRMFVTAERELSIDPTFRNFRGIRELRAQLAAAGIEVEDHFTPYGAWFRRRLGIRSEQALDLFHQTVSMKAVGNLTDFVRTHMLAAEPVRPRIDALVTHFDDLTRAHAAVLRAKRQVQLLEPLLEDCTRHGAETAEREMLEGSRRALRRFFTTEKISLVERAVERLVVEHAKAEAAVERRREQRQAARDAEERLHHAIRTSGGDDLRRLDDEVATLTRERDTRRAAAVSFAQATQRAGLPVVDSEAAFVDVQGHVERQRADLDSEDRQLVERVAELTAEMTARRDERASLLSEIDNLLNQRGNIPREQMELRGKLCADLGIDEAVVPFAGELVRVAEGEVAWEGATERLLRNFALSLLVPDAHYDAVQRWVDERHLRAKVVYFRIPVHVRPPSVELHRAALFHKLELRTDLPRAQALWLDTELQRRAGVVCCDTPAQFQRERSAITMAGQIKGGNDRHEKDDRFPLSDRRRYVLGWSNESKVAALRGHVATLERAIGDVAATLAGAEAGRAQQRDRHVALGQLAMVTDFRSIDWEATAADIAARIELRQRLLAASDRLGELQAELTSATARYREADAAFDRANQELAKVATRLDDHRREHDELQQQLEALGPPPEPLVVERLSQRLVPLGLASARTTNQLNQLEAEARDALTAEVDAAVKRIDRLTQRIVGQMQAFRHEFPAETQEIDASLDGASGFADLLAQLRNDDLPRFEAHFAELLTENTLREIANFQAHLHKERSEIGERVERINTSLETIEYNPDRYIALVLEPTRDVEIREFQADLRACTEGTLAASDDPGFAEAKFGQVRALIDRFKGRPDLADADRRWTAKVTDVRNWYTFAASERWLADDSEYEHYSDSVGKSGGQKEKLAYTVLAASLAYQFGLEIGESRSRSFRFVAIDEAFGRADADATEFGLELFKRLHLQLLVVTPLQRISLIEPYVRRVGFVSRSEERSRITNLTIEEYRAERERRGPSPGEPGGR